jgi:hypothetical protein
VFDPFDVMMTELLVLIILWEPFYDRMAPWLKATRVSKAPAPVFVIQSVLHRIGDKRHAFPRWLRDSKDYLKRAKDSVIVNKATGEVVCRLSADAVMHRVVSLGLDLAEVPRNRFPSLYHDIEWMNAIVRVRPDLAGHVEATF